METPTDVDAMAIWNAAYAIDSPSLWGNPPVPYATSVAERFAASSPSLVLDLPCGDGRNLPTLADSGSRVVVGADSSDGALELARRRCAVISNLVLTRASVFDTGFPDEHFDGVLCWDLLGHLQHPREALRELLRVCRRGGLLVASVFAPGDSTWADDRMVPLDEGTDAGYLFDNKYYFSYYSQSRAAQLCAGLPAVLEDISLQSWIEPPHEGYREYEHEHQSWAVVLRKT